MNKGKMMAVSLVITVCFTTLAVIFLLWQNQKAESAEEKEPKVENLEEVTVEETEGEYKPKGIRVVNDEAGLHDIFFSDQKTGYVSNTSPVNVKVTSVHMERFLPESKEMKVLVDGRTEVTLLKLTIVAENVSNKPVRFDLLEGTVKMDNHETGKVEKLLSDEVSDALAAGEKKSGQIVIPLNSFPRNLAYFNLSFKKPLDENFEPTGDDITLKINLF